jgi:hypothetical protein
MIFEMQILDPACEEALPDLTMSNRIFRHSEITKVASLWEQFLREYSIIPE